jgi:hypothetical protein
MKICSKCKQEKPFNLFYNKNKRDDLYYSWCKDCCKKSSAEATLNINATIEGRAKSALINAKRRTSKNGHELLLEVKDIIDLWEKQSGVCAYSGMNMTLNSNELNTMSLERIDSSIGYTKENTILICHAVNRMKSNFEVRDFYKFCSAVSDFLVKTKFLD